MTASQRLLSSRSEDKMAKMLAVADKLEAHYRHLFDFVVVNDDLAETVAVLHDLVTVVRTSPQWLPNAWARRGGPGTFTEVV